MSTDLSLTKLFTLWGISKTTYASFKALHRRRRYVTLIQEHNEKCAPHEQINGPALLNRIDKLEIVPHLQFWTVMAFVNLYDAYVEMFFSWIPFYSVAKAVFLLFIIVPQTKGAVFVFDMLVAPQLQKRVQWIDEVLAPRIRLFTLHFAHRLMRFTLDNALSAVSARELKDMTRQIDALLRDVTREGYVRRRDESIEALKDTIPEEKHRVALLDDILREYPDEDNVDTWTELSVQPALDGIVKLRVLDGEGAELEEASSRDFVLAEHLQMLRLREAAATGKTE